MAIIKTGTFTTTASGVAQNLNLGFVPSRFEMWNDTSIATPTSTEIAGAFWFNTMANASAYVYTYNATPIQVLTKITTNGFTPFQTVDSALWLPTNLTITAISKAANASITATHNFTSDDVGVTVVTFHNVVGMTQINTLSGVIQTVTSTTSFTVNINSTSFTTYVSGGIANVITGIPAETLYANSWLNTAQANQGIIGLTLGTTLMASTADVWNYMAVLDTPVTS